MTGTGFGWGEHHHDVFEGCRRFFEPGYRANLVQSWIPALDGIEEKLRAGGRVADIGCGHGASSIVIADAYPQATVHGTDAHDGSIAEARRLAAEAGVGDRVTFSTVPADALTAGGYDLVTSFDCLHDMGDPVGVARQVRAALAPGGAWMIVEPRAGDTVEENLNPVGRAYYAFSTLLCTPSSLSQEVGLALGAQAGEARLKRGARVGRLHQRPARGRDAVQPRAGSARVGASFDSGPVPAGPERLRQRGSRVDAELEVDVAQVVLDGLRAEVERRRGLAGGLALRQQQRDPQLLRGQLVE